jgi:glyoxylase-like metal-dependent hydrolase (beta-lactamase superfamily II)
VVPLATDDVIPLHLADLSFPSWHPLAGQVGEVFAFALRHPTGLLLYETGIGTRNEVLDGYYRIVHHPIEEQLEAHGHRLADVRLIVNSHLHFDPVGTTRSSRACRSRARRPGHLLEIRVRTDPNHGCSAGGRPAAGPRPLPDLGVEADRPRGDPRVLQS